MGKRPWIETDGHNFRYVDRPVPVYRPGGYFWTAVVLGLLAWAIMGGAALYLGIL